MELCLHTSFMVLVLYARIFMLFFGTLFYRGKITKLTCQEINTFALTANIAADSRLLHGIQLDSEF